MYIREEDINKRKTTMPTEIKSSSFLALAICPIVVNASEYLPSFRTLKSPKKPERPQEPEIHGKKERNTEWQYCDQIDDQKRPQRKPHSPCKRVAVPFARGTAPYAQDVLYGEDDERRRR
jgi:hypothetical protein